MLRIPFVSPTLQYDRAYASRTFLLIGLVGLVILSRAGFTSSPYFVDGPRQVAAITSGKLFIQPPGYFLFDFFGREIYLTHLLSAATSVAVLNITLSVLGTIFFFALSVRLFPGAIGIMLAVAYAFSDTVWFTAEVHSTYAAMTFFAPAILYFVLIQERWWLVGLLWALMTGIRPSDGAFVLPCLFVLLLRRGWRDRIAFLATALPVVLLWYVPTVQHFGGQFLSPLSSAEDEVHSLANGLLVPGVSWARKIGNTVHLGLSVLNALNILTPFAVIGLFARSRVNRVAMLWCLPGLLFFFFYFFSSSVYLAYMVAPALVLAGSVLRGMSRGRSVAILACSIACSIVQMAVLRPVRISGTKTAILDAYTLQYTGWALKHRYSLRLRDIVEKHK